MATCKQSVEVKQSKEDRRNVTENDNVNVIGFIEENKNEEISTRVFDDLSKENIERVEEYLDKLEGAIELEEESNDTYEIFKEEGLEGKVHDTLIQFLDY